MLHHLPLACRLALGAGLLTLALATTAGAACAPIGTWIAPGGAALSPAEVLVRASRQSVVLLGESHDRAEHHRWQLQMLAALAAARPRMVIAFEMFPRRVQPALDRWVAGELSEREFLAAADWRKVWAFDPSLYLPLFNFARMNRIPMVAANVDAELVRAVGRKGFDGVPEASREGVSRPAAARAAYVDSIAAVWSEHQPEPRRGPPARDDPEFLRFVESQQVWDRAMAQAIAGTLARDPAALVVGIMGSGHVAHGHGVAHQLKDLGVSNVAALLPWDQDGDCAELAAGIADAVFGVAAPAAKGAPRPRLGVSLEQTGDGVRIQRVDTGSIAEAAGLRDGDVVAEAAGTRVVQSGDLAAVVQRQAPGTWLPLKVKREGGVVELVAKFPALQE